MEHHLMAAVGFSGPKNFDSLALAEFFADIEMTKNRAGQIDRRRGGEHGFQAAAKGVCLQRQWKKWCPLQKPRIGGDVARRDEKRLHLGVAVAEDIAESESPERREEDIQDQKVATSRGLDLPNGLVGMECQRRARPTQLDKQ